MLAKRGIWLELTGDFTIAAWIKLEAGNTVRYMLAKTPPGIDELSSAGAYGVYKNADEELCHRASGRNGAGLCSAGSIADKMWQHWAIVKAGRTVRSWRDGVLDRSIANVAANRTPRANGNRPAIGRRSNAGNLWFGWIDDLRIYDRALSEEEASPSALSRRSGRRGRRRRASWRR